MESPAEAQQPLGQVPRADEAILVAVLNEEGAIGKFLVQLAPAARHRRVYLLDSDSTDGTVAEAQDAASRVGVDLRLVRSPPGLAESIRTGLANTVESRVAVLDGDGQHDTAIVDTLFEALRSGADLAVGSRNVAGASVAEDWPWYRSWGANVLSWLARLATWPRGVKDPLAGCFAVKRAAWDEVADRFETGGYKFLLDFLAVSCERLVVAESPLTFKARIGGTSKMALPVFWEVLVSLQYCLFRGRVPRRWLGFGSVGVLGLVTDTLLTGLLLNVVGMPFVWARPLPVLVAMTQNYAMNNRFTFRDAQRKGTHTLAAGWLLYVACQTVGAVANWGVSVLVYNLGAPWFLALPTGVLAGMAVNFMAARRVVWKKPPASRPDQSGPP